MAEQIHKQKTSTAEKQQVEQTEVKSTDKKDAQALKDELDGLLDEIDGVLEENAEDFVRGYVQKGGE